MRAFESSSLLADPAPIWLGDAPSLADDDPMAQVLPWLIRHLGVAEALADETGLDDAACRARPGQLLQSLQQLGFDTQLSHDPLTGLRAADLPAVLRLRTGDACVLTALQAAPGGLRRCQVVVLTPEPMVFTVTDVDLARECAGPALLIRRPLRPQRAAEPAPAPAPVRAAEPAAEPPSALARALAGRRAALAAQVAAEMPAASAVPVAPNPPSWHARPPAPVPVAAAPDMSASAPAAPTMAAATVAPAHPQPPTLPTLDDVIEADELAALVARATGPGREHWLQAPPLGAAAMPTPPVQPQVSAPPPDPVALPQMALPQPARLAPPMPVAVPRAQPAPTPAQTPAPREFPPPLQAADTGPDVVLDLGFLDRQTGAGRLRGQIAQWQHRLRRQIDHLASTLPQGLVLRPAPHAATRPPGGAVRQNAPLPGFAAAGAAGATPSPGRTAGWRPRFGLGWPLGHAPNSAAAANSAAPPARREPTLSALSDDWRDTVPPDPGLDLDFGRAEAPQHAATPPQAVPRRVGPAPHAVGRSAPSSVSQAWQPPVTHAAQPLASATAAFFAEPPPTRSSRPAHAAGAALSAGAGRSVWTQRLRALLTRSAWRPRAGQGAGRAVHLAGPPSLTALASAVHPTAGGWLTGLGDRLKGRLRGHLSAGLTGGLAAHLTAGPALRLRQATAVARRGAASAGRHLERGLGLPLLAACSAVCLLDGLPLAWAGMVSLSGLKAAAHLLPGLMRQALAADQAQAAAMLSGATATTAAARARAPGTRSAVPPAANAPRLASAAATPASADASTLAMVAARAERAERAEKAERARARARGIDVATTLRRRSEVLAMGPPAPAARSRRHATSLAELLAA